MIDYLYIKNKNAVIFREISQILHKNTVIFRNNTVKLRSFATGIFREFVKIRGKPHVKD